MGSGKAGAVPLPMLSFVTKQFLALLSKKTAGDRDAVIALLEDEPARDETRAPLVVFRAALAAKRVDIFLRNTVNDRAYS